MNIIIRNTKTGQFMQGTIPPSRKGIKWTKESIEKRTKSRVNYKHKEETIIKIQEARNKYYNLVGRKTKVVQRLKRTKKYSTWRSNVFSRDNYTCQFCYKRGGTLNADHIIPKTKFINRENTIEELKNKAELWDLSNGRTLCLDCHRKTDTYGRKALLFV